MKRFIDIKGAYNVRGVGGYTTQNGRKIKWRKIYRSGKISRIKVSKNDKMVAMNLTAVRQVIEQGIMNIKFYRIKMLIFQCYMK